MTTAEVRRARRRLRRLNDQIGRLLDERNVVEASRLNQEARRLALLVYSARPIGGLR